MCLLLIHSLQFTVAFYFTLSRILQESPTPYCSNSKKRKSYSLLSYAPGCLTIPCVKTGATINVLTGVMLGTKSWYQSLARCRVIPKICYILINPVQGRSKCFVFLFRDGYKIDCILLWGQLERQLNATSERWPLQTIPHFVFTPGCRILAMGLRPHGVQGEPVNWIEN